MKHLRKLITFAVILVMLMAFMAPAAMAADSNTGEITLTNAAIGMKYAAYKILDATYSGDLVAYTTKTPAVFKTTDTVWEVQENADQNDNYSVTLISGKTAENVNAWIKDNLSSFTAITPTGVDADGKATVDTLVWSDLEYGYYYITSGLGANVTVNSAVPSANVIDKNATAPSALAKTANLTTAQIGDEVVFQVSFKATNFITAEGDNGMATEEVTSYTVTDTANGFDYVEGSLEVTVDGTAVTPASAIFTQQTATSTGSLVIALDWLKEGKQLYDYEAEVEITYKGIVNGFVGTADSTNDVTVTNNTSDATLDVDAVTVNQYSLSITKVDGEDKALTGAKFSVYRNSVDAANLLKLVPVTVDNAATDTLYYRVAEDDETGITVIEQTEDTYSKTVIYGLDGADTYCIEEVEAPKGYNKIEDAIVHAMNNADGEEKVENLPGALLPSTGGMGTTIFYVLGGLMVLCALVVMITNKRMRAQQ